MGAREGQHTLRAWHALLQQIAMARSHGLPNTLDGSGPPAASPVVDRLMPSILFVQLVALLDTALIQRLNASDQSVPRACKSLYARLSLLHKRGELRAFDALCRLKDRRNALVHSASESCEWQELDAALSTIEIELQAFGFAEGRPEYEPFAERSAVTDSSDPAVMCEWRYRFGLRLQGVDVLAFEWTKRLFRDESS